MDPIRLSPDQIKRMDELGASRRAVDMTLRVAINYAANRIYSLERDIQEWWDGMFETHDVSADGDGHGWKMDRIDAHAVMRPITEDEYRDSYEPTIQVLAPATFPTSRPGDGD